MPLYDYCCDNPKCEKSRKILPAVVPLAKCDDPVPCPSCKKPLRKLLSAPMFRVN